MQEKATPKSVFTIKLLGEIILLVLAGELFLLSSDIAQVKRVEATQLAGQNILQAQARDNSPAALTPWSDWPGIELCLSKCHLPQPSQEKELSDLRGDLVKQCQTIVFCRKKMSDIMSEAQKELLLQPQSSISAFKAIGSEGSERYIPVYAVYDLQQVVSRSNSVKEITSLSLVPPANYKFQDWFSQPQCPTNSQLIQSMSTTRLVQGLRQLCQGPQALSCHQAQEILLILQQLRLCQEQINGYCQRGAELLSPSHKRQCAQLPLRRRDYWPTPSSTTALIRSLPASYFQNSSPLSHSPKSVKAN